VKEVNKNVLVIAVTLLAVAMLATPLIGTAMAQKTTTVITRTPGVDSPTEVIIEEILGDRDRLSGSGNTLIRSGTFRTVAYGSESDDRGPLGFGTKYVETITSISHGSGEIVNTPLGPTPMHGYGHGIYKVTFVIESGPYGTGTLEATERQEWEWDFSAPNPLDWRYEAWSSYSLKQGTGDFAGIRVDIESYFNMWIGYYHTKTTIVNS
jgi:hypothetical protein